MLFLFRSRVFDSGFCFAFIKLLLLLMLLLLQLPGDHKVTFFPLCLCFDYLWDCKCFYVVVLEFMAIWFFFYRCYFVVKTHQNYTVKKRKCLLHRNGRLKLVQNESLNTLRWKNLVDSTNSLWNWSCFIFLALFFETCGRMYFSFTLTFNRNARRNFLNLIFLIFMQK